MMEDMNPHLSHLAINRTANMARRGLTIAKSKQLASDTKAGPSFRKGVLSNSAPTYCVAVEVRRRSPTNGRVDGDRFGFRNLNPDREHAGRME